MARRSATNERYQKHTSPGGKTRKSAAAARPKRATGAAPASGSGSTKSSGPKKREPIFVHPPTAEYRRWRTIWWALLGAAIVLTGASSLLRADYATVSNVVLGLGYSCIFGALYVDWTRLRRLRAEWIKAGKPPGDTAHTKS